MITKIIKHWSTFSIAIVSLLGGFFWGYNSHWDYEPVILCTCAALQILGFFFLKSPKVEIPVVQNSKGNRTGNRTGNQRLGSEEMDFVIESKKSKVRILFIDDDTRFKVVKILKDSGWKYTKSVPDIKSLDLLVVKESDILFIDINGVGKLLNLEYEGLDLAFMLKQKYVEKKIIIYSAKRDTNAFHPAWDLIDHRLEKNALPYQFQNLVEKYSLQMYNK